MSKTVDLVIVAGDASAICAAIDAARSGMRVLVVIGSTRMPLIRRLRRALRAAGKRVQRGVTVLTNAEVVCVDGIDRVEAVIVRRIDTGRLIGVNAAAIHVLGAANESSSVETEKEIRASSSRRRIQSVRNGIRGGIGRPVGPGGPVFGLRGTIGGTVRSPTTAR